MSEDTFTPPAPGLPHLIRVIDFETTGTPEDDGAEVIELGRIDIDLETGLIGNPWEGRARPVRGIPAVTKAVHHINDHMVEKAPAIAAQWGPFWEGCGPDDVVAAHNAKFEQHFHSGNGRRWICTYKCALVVWPDAPGHSNQVLRYWLDLDGSDPEFNSERAFPPHAALPDAYVTAHILQCLLLEKSVDELVMISRYPALMRRISFGKHRGLTYEEAPADYLEWIRDKSEMNEDVKFTAKYWLKKRGT
ncbi:MAG: hypothetical protein RL299_1913 [Pseudomonadota bacterium]|jgi:exodeoxyribonuclease X